MFRAASAPRPGTPPGPRRRQAVLHRFAREAAGLKDLHLWRNEGDPTEVIVLFQASDLAKAKEFIGSSNLKEKMQAAGVQGTPDIVFLSES